MSSQQTRTIKMQFVADTSAAQRSLQTLAQTLNNITTIDSTKTGFGLTTKMQGAIESAKTLQSVLQSAVNVDTGKLNLNQFMSNLSQAGTSIAALSSSLAGAGSLGTQAFTQLASAVARAEAPMRQMNATLAGMMTTLANTVKWQLSSSAIHGLMSGFSSAVGYVKDLNSSLNNIRIVTGQSVDDMARFALKANEAAKALSTTTNAYAKASLIYYQQGDTAAEAARKAEITLKAANASFNTSAEQMSEYLTAVWNSYQVGADELERYVDIMAALGAKTATSLEEIATSMQKVAATANTVGVSMEEVSSIISTVSSVTRESAESIGTSFKTIFARIGDLKLGETLEDGVGLGQVSSALKKINVEVLDSVGNMREMGDIITDLGNRWQTLSQAQKTATAQVVAGKRQYTQLMALFENWDQYNKSLNIAQNAEGELQNQANIYATSWEGASNRVRAAWEGVWGQLFKDEALIKMTNTLADIVNGVGDVVKGFGGLQGVLVTVGNVMLSMFKNQLATNIDNAIMKMHDFKASFEGLSKGDAFKSFFTQSTYQRNTKRVTAQLNAGLDTAKDQGQRRLDAMRAHGTEPSKALKDETYMLGEQYTATQRLLRAKNELVAMGPRLSQANQQVAQQAIENIDKEIQKMEDLKRVTSEARQERNTATSAASGAAAAQRYVQGHGLQNATDKRAQELYDRKAKQAMTTGFGKQVFSSQGNQEGTQVAANIGGGAQGAVTAFADQTAVAQAYDEVLKEIEATEQKLKQVQGDGAKAMKQRNAIIQESQSKLTGMANAARQMGFDKVADQITIMSGKLSQTNGVTDAAAQATNNWAASSGIAQNMMRILARELGITEQELNDIKAAAEKGSHGMIQLGGSAENTAGIWDRLNNSLKKNKQSIGQAITTITSQIMVAAQGFNSMKSFATSLDDANIGSILTSIGSAAMTMGQTIKTSLDLWGSHPIMAIILLVIQGAMLLAGFLSGQAEKAREEKRKNDESARKAAVEQAAALKEEVNAVKELTTNFNTLLEQKRQGLDVDEELKNAAMELAAKYNITGAALNSLQGDYEEFVQAIRENGLEKQIAQGEIAVSTTKGAIENHSALSDDKGAGGSFFDVGYASDDYGAAVKAGYGGVDGANVWSFGSNNAVITQELGEKISWSGKTGKKTNRNWFKEVGLEDSIINDDGNIELLLSSQDTADYKIGVYKKLEKLYANLSEAGEGGSDLGIQISALLDTMSEEIEAYESAVESLGEMRIQLYANEWVGKKYDSTTHGVQEFAEDYTATYQRVADEIKKTYMSTNDITDANISNWTEEQQQEYQTKINNAMQTIVGSNSATAGYFSAITTLFNAYDSSMSKAKQALVDIIGSFQKLNLRLDETDIDAEMATIYQLTDGRGEQWSSYLISRNSEALLETLQQMTTTLAELTLSDDMSYDEMKEFFTSYKTIREELLKNFGIQLKTFDELMLMPYEERMAYIKSIQSNSSNMLLKQAEVNAAAASDRAATYWNTETDGSHSLIYNSEIARRMFADINMPSVLTGSLTRRDTGEVRHGVTEWTEDDWLAYENNFNRQMELDSTMLSYLFTTGEDGKTVVNKSGISIDPSRGIIVNGTVIPGSLEWLSTATGQAIVADWKKGTVNNLYTDTNARTTAAHGIALQDTFQIQGPVNTATATAARATYERYDSYHTAADTALTDEAAAQDELAVTQALIQQTDSVINSIERLTKALSKLPDTLDEFEKVAEAFGMTLEELTNSTKEQRAQAYLNNSGSIKPTQEQFAITQYQHSQTGEIISEAEYDLLDVSDPNNWLFNEIQGTDWAAYSAARDQWIKGQTDAMSIVSQQDLDNLNTYNSTLTALTKTYQNFLQTGKLDNSTRQALLLAGITPESIQTIEDYEAAIEDLHEKAIQSAENLRTIVTNSTKDLDIEINWDFMTIGTTWVEFVASQTEEVQRYLLSDEGAWIQTFFEQWRTSSVQAETALDGFSAAAVKSSQASNELSATLKQQKEEWQKITEAAQSARTVLDSFSEDSNTITFASLAQLKQDIIDAGLELADFQNYINTILNPNSSQEQRDQATFDMKNKLLISELATLYDEALPYTSTTIKIESYLVNGNNTDSPILDSYDAKIRATITKAGGVAGPDTTEGRILNDALNDDGTGTVDGTASYEYTVQKGKSGTGEGTGEPNSFDQTVIDDATPDGSTAGTANYTYTVSPDGGNNTDSTGTGVDYDREIAEDAATDSGGNADYTYTVRPDSSWTSIASSVIWGSTYGKIVEDILLGPDGKTGKIYTVTIQKGTATEQLTLSEEEWALIQRWMNATSDELNPDPINFALVFEDGLGAEWQTTVDNYITAWNAYIATHKADPLLFNWGFSQIGLIDEILEPDGNGGYVLKLGTLQLAYDLIPYDLEGDPKDSIAESMWAMVDTNNDGKIDEGMGGFLTYTYKLVYELEEDGETVKLDANGKPIVKNPDAIFGMYTNAEGHQEVMTPYQVYWKWAQDPNSHEGDPPAKGEGAAQLILNANDAAIVYWAYVNNQEGYDDGDYPFLPEGTTLETYTIDWYYKYVNNGQPLENMIKDALAAEGLTPGTEQYQQRYGQLIGYTMSLGLDDSTLKDADALAAALTGRDWLEASKTYGIELDLNVNTDPAADQIDQFIVGQQRDKKVVLGVEVDNMPDGHFLETFASLYDDPDRRYGAGMQQLIKDMIPYLPDRFFLSLGMDKQQFIRAMEENPDVYVNKFGELLMQDAERGGAARAILRDSEQQPIEFDTADRQITRLHLDKALFTPQEFEEQFNSISAEELSPGSTASQYYIEDGLALVSSLVYQGRWQEAAELYEQLSGMDDFTTVQANLQETNPTLLAHLNWAQGIGFNLNNHSVAMPDAVPSGRTFTNAGTGKVSYPVTYVGSEKIWYDGPGNTYSEEWMDWWNGLSPEERMARPEVQNLIRNVHPAVASTATLHPYSVRVGTGDAGGSGDGYAHNVSLSQEITLDADARDRLIAIGDHLVYDPETQMIYIRNSPSSLTPYGVVSTNQEIWNNETVRAMSYETSLFGAARGEDMLRMWNNIAIGNPNVLKSGNDLELETYDWIQSDIQAIRQGQKNDAHYILEILPTILQDAISSGVINLEDKNSEGFKYGQAIMQFIADGLTAGLVDIEDAIEGLERLGLDDTLFYTLAKIFEIHSPSHITQRIGRWIVLGLQKGIDDEAKTINFDSIEETALGEIASLDQHLMDGIKGMTFPDMLERAFDVSDGIFNGINFSPDDPNNSNKNFIADLADGEITDLSQYPEIANIIARDKHNRFLDIAGLSGGNFAEGNPITKGALQFGGIWKNAQLNDAGKLALVQYYNITPVGVDGAEIPLTLTLETGEANEELIKWLNSDATRDAVQAAYEADVYPSTLTAEDLTDGAIGALFDPTDEYYFANNSAISGKGRAAMQATFESVKASAENANNALIDAQGNIVDLDAFLPVFWEHWNTAGTQAMNKIESKWKELEDLWLSAVENAYQAEQERAQKVLDLWTSTFKTISKMYTELFGGKTISDIISPGSDDFTNWITHGLANGRSFTNLMSMWWMNGSQVASQYTWDPAQHSMTDYQEATDPLDRNYFIKKDTHGVPMYEASRARVNAQIAAEYSGNETYKKLISDTVGESITEMLTTYNTAVTLGDTTTAQIYGAILDTIIEGGTKDGQNNSGIMKTDEDGDGVFTYTIVDADAAETTTDTVRSQSNWEAEVMSRFIQNRQFSSDEEWQQYQIEYFQNYLTQTGNLHKTQLEHYDAIISQNASDITLLDKFLDNDSSFTGFSPEDTRRIKELQAQYPTMTVEEIIETLVQGQITASANKQDHENRLAMGWHWVEGADGTMQWVVPTVTTSAPTTVMVGEGDNATQITGTWTNDEEQAAATKNAADLLGIDPALIGSGWFTNAPGQQTRYSWASDGNGGYILQQEVQTISYNTPDASVLPPINTSEYTEKDRKRIAENYGLEYAEVQNTMEILQESDALSNKPEEAFELAIQIERQDRAVSELTSSWDTLTDAIDETNKGSIDYTKNIRKMLKLTEDFLGLDYGVLPESFLESEENLKLMEKAIKGDADALNELQVIAANAIAEQNGITLDESLAETIAEDTTLEVGATITYTPDTDNTALANSINQMYMSAYNAAIAGGASVAEAMKIANDMMNAVGYDVAPVEMEEVTYYANGQVPDGYEPQLSGNSVIGPNGEVLEGITWSATEGGEYTYPVKVLQPKGTGLNITRLSEGGSGIPQSSGGGGGGGGKKKPTERKKYSEVERYHEIEGSLKAIENEMSKIEKLRERSFGPEKIEVLEAELQLLQKQKEAQEVLAAEASDWIASDQELLNSLVDGVEYLEDGRIANWSELQHQWIDEYNAAVAAADAMTDDEEKQEALEAAQKEYDRKVEALKNYEDSIAKALEAGLALEEIINQMSAKLLEKIQYNVEYKMELNESDLEIMEYYLDTFEDDVFKSAESMDNMMAQITTHLDNLQTLKEGYNELIKEYNNGAGLIADADFQAGLKEFQSQIIDTLGELNDLKKEMKEFYEDVLENASEELENHTEKLDAIVETMESYASIQELMGKGVNYEWLTGIYQTQYEANRALLTANKEYLDNLIKARDEATDPDLIEAYNDAIVEANKSLLESTEAVLETLQKIYENTIASIFDTLDKSLAGTADSVEELSEDYAYYQEVQERYVSTAKELHEVSKLNRDIEKSINETASQTNKNLLKQLQERIKAQSKMNELTQYDLDMNQKQYELLLAKIALEEAQNAKDTVRLVRDANGNYAYQYTADQGKIDEAEQRYEDALYAIHELSAERIKTMEQEMIDARQTFLDSAKEIAEAEYDSEDERYEDLLKLFDQYKERMTYSYAEYEEATDHLGINAQSFAELFGVSVDEIYGGSSLMNEALSALFALGADATFEDAWTAIQEVMKAAKEREDAVKDATDEAGTSLDGMSGNADQASGAIGGLIGEITDLNTKLGAEFIEVNKVADAWLRLHEVLTSTSLDYEQIAENMQKLQEAIGTEGLGLVLGDLVINGDAMAGVQDTEDQLNPQMPDGTTQYATGGLVDYTGPAWVDGTPSKPELMLNATDTPRFLEAIKIARQINFRRGFGDSSIGQYANIISDTLEASMAAMYDVMANSYHATDSAFRILSAIKSEPIDQVVTIDAHFPSVTNHTEIEDALNDLINQASHFTNRNF